jgi:uncharacterized protein YqgC (DUF456 family)
MIDLRHRHSTAWRVLPAEREPMSRLYTIFAVIGAILGFMIAPELAGLLFGAIIGAIAAFALQFFTSFFFAFRDRLNQTKR